MNLTVPEALQDRVSAICTFPRHQHGPNGDLHVSGLGMRIVLKEIATGIIGVPARLREVAELHAKKFNQVLILQVPPGERDARVKLREQDQPYDERGYEMSFLLRGAGYVRHVWNVCDELTVLQWIYENDLTALYEISALTSFGILPQRDIDRLRCEEHEFHIERLLRRLMNVHFGERVVAHAALLNSARARELSEE